MKDLNKIYFLGIGGIGMSALARYFSDLGMEVCGYDKTETTLTKKLVEEGMKIHYDDDIRRIPEGIDLVIYTPAIPPEHEEFNYFRRNYYTLKKRAEILGIISRSKKTIAVAGTHGKTTTSSMISHILHESNFACSALVGGLMTNYNSNYIRGSNDWIVVEADEYDRSFLHLQPDLAIIMSIDADHLDIYGKHDQMKRAFEDFTLNIKDSGVLIIKKGLKSGFSKEWVQMMDDRRVEIIEFGEDQGDYHYGKMSFKPGNFSFDLVLKGEVLEGIELKLPGKHNVENASAALITGKKLGLAVENLKKAMGSFSGIKRRFEFVLEDESAVFIDDYAHHPTELNAAIDAARRLYPDKKVTGVFQPHLYSRTRDFAGAFAEELDRLDEIILLDIYPARERPIEGVSSRIIFDKMKNENKSLIDKGDLINEIKKRKIEVLMTLGAGDIDTEIEGIQRILTKND